MDRRVGTTVILSLLAHALLPLGVVVGARHGEPAASRIAEPAATHVAEVALAGAGAARRALAREALVRAARADRRDGKLALGRFLLRANQIDAEERGEPFDVAEAEARYAARLQALREALQDSDRGFLDLRDAVPAVLSDLRYQGRPGGLMAEALLESGGSCEQVSQLVAALVFDAGRASDIALRFYGGAMSDGAAHLAAIAVRGDEEYDLLSGREAIKTGSRFPAADLVEVYARLHGLAPRVEPRRGAAGHAGPGSGLLGRIADSGAPEGDGARAPARATMVPGYPQNEDRYPGTLPLYAARAVQEAGAPAKDTGVAEAAHARDCAYLLRMAILSPPQIDVDRAGAASFVIEPYRVPNPPRLEREAALLRAAEDLAGNSAAEPADRLMGWACLAGLGDVAAIDFTLAGERRLATLAMEKRRRGRDKGGAAVAAIRWSGEEGARVRRRLSEEFAGRTWLLLTLEGGAEIVLDLVRSGRSDDWGQVSALAALVVAPATRARALAIIERLPRSDQVDVMHEVFHAHDHMRPWASTFDLGGALSSTATATGPGATWRRVYRVFRGLAWRLWEGQRPTREILDALAVEARGAGLDAAWHAALLEYCGKNLLGLHASRPDGLETVRTLRAAVGAFRRGPTNAEHALDRLQRVLDYIESMARLDATTLADAMRPGSEPAQR